MSDPEQFPVLRGEVRQLTLTARGDIDGLNRLVAVGPPAPRAAGSALPDVPPSPQE